MKNSNLILIVLLMIINFSCSNRVKVISKWDNGNNQKTRQKLKTNYVIETFYYQSGVKESEISLFNDKLDGVTKHWSVDGKLVSESKFENGELHGLTIHYYSNEKVKHSVEYFYGQKHGYDKWYYRNGQIKTESLYQYGVQKSETIRWTEDGQLAY